MAVSASMTTMLSEKWAEWNGMVEPLVFEYIEKVSGEDIRKTPSLAMQKGPEFMKSPTVVVTAGLVYSIFCFLAKLLVKQKKKGTPDPAWLKRVVFFHNVFLVGLSSYMSGGIILNSYNKGMTPWGSKYDENDKTLSDLTLIFTLSKLYEFLDTVIMVLKGNMYQVTFLHCYHHVSVSFFWWMAWYIMPGGDSWLGSALNSFVHVVMYSYYLLASMSSDPSFRKKYLWWGRYLTTFQMLQFVENGIHCVLMIKYKWYSKVMATFGIYYMISLFILFGNFFVKKYIAGATASKKTKKQ